MQIFAFFPNRHQGAFFTRPQSVDNMRKSKSIFPVDMRLTFKIRLAIIHLKRRFAFNEVVAWHWKQIAFLASMSVCLPTLMQGLSKTFESRWVPILRRRKSCKCWQRCVMMWTNIVTYSKKSVDKTAFNYSVSLRFLSNSCVEVWVGAVWQMWCKTGFH